MPIGETDSWLRHNAGRLLRQKWGSPTALAEELYAIIADAPAGAASAASPEAKARKPDEIKAPDSISARPPRGVIAQAAQARAGEAPVRFSSPGPAPESAVSRARRGPFRGTAPGKPFSMANPFPDWEWSLPIGGGGGGGTTSFVGQVQGDIAGPDIQVTLYPNGHGGPPGKTVAVHVLQLLDTETIPDGTWISGIQQMADTATPPNVIYEVQVPIWLG